MGSKRILTDTEVADFVEHSTKRHDAQEKRLITAEEGIADLKDAFPAADLSGHRRYHELIIRRTEEIRRLRVAIQEKTISALVWILLLWLAKMLWEGSVKAIAISMGIVK